MANFKNEDRDPFIPDVAARFHKLGESRIRGTGPARFF